MWCRALEGPLTRWFDWMARSPSTRQMCSRRTHDSQALDETLIPGRYVSLVELDTDQSRVKFVYELLVSKSDAFSRARFRGRAPTLDEFLRSRRDGIFEDYVALARSKGEWNRPVGYVFCYGMNQRDGYAFIGASVVPNIGISGVAFQALVTFAHHLCCHNPLRKLYFDVPAYVAPALNSAVGRFLHLEGRFKEHEFAGGRYWDTYRFAAYREDVDAARALLDRRSGRQV